jgi:hypothetical protein
LTVAPPDIDSRVLIVQLGVALLDSAVLALLWLVLRRAGLGQRTALLGAALYLLPPPIMASFSRGEYANLGGQVLALPALALLALGTLPQPAAAWRPQRWRNVMLWALVLAGGLLVHMGVAISLALVLALVWALAVAWRVWHPATAPFSPVALTIGGGLAALLAVVMYYSAPLYVELFGERLASESDTSAALGQPPLAVLHTLLWSLLEPGRYLLTLTLALGAVGTAWLWFPQGEQTIHRRRVAVLLLAWWSGILLSFGLLLIADQGVRWQHFLYPALCLSGGVALARVWQRGHAGQVVAWAALLAILSHGLLVWVWQIYDYLH